MNISIKQLSILLSLCLLISLSCIDPSQYERSEDLDPESSPEQPISNDMSDTRPNPMTDQMVAGQGTMSMMNQEGGATQAESEQGGMALNEPVGGMMGGAELGGQMSGQGLNGQGDMPLAGQEADPPETCLLTFELALPSSTPTDATVYLAGNLFAPQWNPQDTRGEMTRDGLTARVTLEQPQFTEISYKFTLGSWESVERSAECAEISNRVTFVRCNAIDPVQRVETSVARWASTDCQ